ncbi:MAG: GlsB/YeaQ/YmgE family stress response membrane protein, partial [Caulobacteraceae bacterium]
ANRQGKRGWRVITMVLWIVEWLILGGVAGFIASKIINKTGEGLVMDIVLGIVGAIVGGFIATKAFGIVTTGPFSIQTLIIAVLGAILVLVVYHMIVRRRV